jgi:hypothetical protein
VNPFIAPYSFINNKKQGRRKKEEGRRKKEEGRRKKEEGRGLTIVN